MGDEREKQEPEDEGSGRDAPPPADDPNQSTEGLLDEQALREHADDVDAAIQEAKSRNG